MAFFDFEQLEGNLKENQKKPSYPPENSEPTEEPNRPPDAVPLPLKMYEAEDRQVFVSPGASVQDLQLELARVLRTELGSMGRLTGVQRGARERFRRRVKGWAMEGHQVLDPSTELRSLHFGSALLCQPRVGPVAEIDLEQLQEVKVSKIQEVQIQEVHIHEVKTPEKAAHQPEERPQSDSKTRSRWSKAPTAPTRAEELARALELELEMDRRRSAPLELLGSSRIQLSPSVVFLVDALNEVLAQMKQHADRIDRLHSEALSKRGAALAKLQEALQAVLRCTASEAAAGALRRLFGALVKPAGLRDCLRDWARALGRRGLVCFSFLLPK